MKNRNAKKQNGFTLIELMIVVAIIGVLSAIAVPAYKDYVSKSEASSALATLKSVITPAELYIQENGSLNNLADLGTTSGANSLGTLSIDTTVSAGLKFVFVSGSLSGADMAFERTNTGWACARTGTVLTSIKLEGCD